jgi:hypothetical protein
MGHDTPLNRGVGRHPDRCRSIRSCLD